MESILTEPKGLFKDRVDIKGDHEISKLLNKCYKVKLYKRGKKGQKCAKYCPRGFWMTPQHS